MAGIDAVRIVAALLLCLGLAVVVILLMRQRMAGGTVRLPGLMGAFGPQAGRRPGQRITVLETRRASPHADICLVAVDGREYLIATGPGGTRLLARLPQS